MKKHTPLSPALLTLVSLFFFSCGDSGRGSGGMAGTATDTENTVAGKVIDSEGKSLPGVIVTLYSNSFEQAALKKMQTDSTFRLGDPDLPHVTDTTDIYGNYLFEMVPTEKFFMRFYLPKALRGNDSTAVFRLDNIQPGDEIGTLRQVSLESPAALEILRGLKMEGAANGTITTLRYRLRQLDSYAEDILESDSGLYISDLYPGTTVLEFRPVDSQLEQQAAVHGISLWQSLEIELESGKTLQLEYLPWTLDSALQTPPSNVSSSASLSSSSSIPSCPVYSLVECPTGQEVLWTIDKDCDVYSCVERGTLSSNMPSSSSADSAGYSSSLSDTTTYSSSI